MTRLRAYRAKADGQRRRRPADVASAYGLARAALAEQPTQMAIAGQLVTLYQTYLQT